MRLYLPDCYGPCSTCYDRFNRWRKAGVRDDILSAITDTRDAKVQMLGTSNIRGDRHAVRQ